MSPARRGRLRRFYLPAGILAAGLVLLLLIVLLCTGLGAQRSLLVDAATRGLSITFDGESTRWDLGPVTYCTRREQMDRSRERGDGLCDARAYDERQGDLSIGFHSGAVARFSESGAEGFVLTVLNHRELGRETRIFLPRARWIDLGSLAFVGQAVLGGAAATGEDALLLGGSYEIREKPMQADRTEVIKQGEIRRGEAVTLGRADRAGDWQDATVYGFVSPDFDIAQAFRVGMVSGAGDNELRVAFFGGAAPVLIAPTWVDRFLSSPRILAIASIMSILLALAQYLGPPEWDGPQTETKTRRPMETLEDHAAAVLALIDRLPRGPGRLLVAVAGPPGSGKSTLAEAVVEALNARGDPKQAAGLVPMDGFHLDNATLDARGLRDRKGAPETFDAEGFAALVRRLRDAPGEIRYPLFSRAEDRTLPDAGRLGAETRIVVVEGNYLLLQDAGWAALRPLFDATVMLAPPIEVLEQRLVARWLDHGMEPEAARARARGNDLANARRVIADSARADLALPRAPGGQGPAG